MSNTNHLTLVLWGCLICGNTLKAVFNINKFIQEDFFFAALILMSNTNDLTLDFFCGNQVFSKKNACKNEEFWQSRNVARSSMLPQKIDLSLWWWVLKNYILIAFLKLAFAVKKMQRWFDETSFFHLKVYYCHPCEHVFSVFIMFKEKHFPFILQ